MLCVPFGERPLWHRAHYRPYDDNENRTSPEHALTFHSHQSNHTIFYNLSENARVFKHGMNRSFYTAGSLLLFLRLCIIISTKDDVGGINRK